MSRVAILWSAVAIVLVSANVGCAQTTQSAKHSVPITDAEPKSAALYQSKFYDAVQHWSYGNVTTSPNRERVFLGGFVDEHVQLNMNELPSHEYIRVSFDVLTLGTWDGNGPLGYGAGGSVSVGPDIFEVRNRSGGQLLMSDTFSNIPNDEGFKSLTRFQSFPSPVPGDQMKAQSASLSHNSLGYVYQAGPGFDMDAVYHVTLLFPHKLDALQMEFRAKMRDPNKEPRLLEPEEFWGLDNVSVETLHAADVKHPSAAQANVLLDKAIDERDPIAAREAFSDLLGGDVETRNVLLAARDAAEVDWKEVDRQIALLSSLDLSTRATARSKLSAMGAVIEMPLRLAELNGETVTGGDQCRALLDEFMGRPIKDAKQRRAAVANRVLQIIGEK